MSGSVIVKRHNNVLVGTVSNPPNALMDTAMIDGLAALTRQADEDESIGGVVLTGAHSTRFLAHFDVREILLAAESSPRLARKVAYHALRTVGAAGRIPGVQSALGRSRAAGLLGVDRMLEVLVSIQRCSAVWVAALNGDTGGGGCELSLACDKRFMADGDYSISQPEVLVGFPPGGGGTQRLTRMLGTSRALRICLDGGPLTPREAEEIGVVDRVVAKEDLLDQAIAEASRLGRRPKHAIGAIKRAVYEGGSLALVDGLRFEAAEFVNAIGHPDSIAAQRAFVKRYEELGDTPACIREEIKVVLERGRFA
jgi:enoyl-CoA hydratase